MANLTTKRVCILGVGQVGRALIQLIRSGRKIHASRFAVQLDVLALGDSSSLVTAEAPLSDDVLMVGERNCIMKLE